jgi:hypothetical protein
MQITEMPPEEVINVWQYRNDLRDGHYHDLDYLREKIGDTICTRLVVNRYGDRDHDFAGHFTLEVASIVEPKSRRNMQPGLMKMVLTASAEMQASTKKKIKPSEYYVSPNGILLPTRRLSWMAFGNEEGYFPTNTESWDDALHRLVALSPPTERLRQRQLSHEKNYSKLS